MDITISKTTCSIDTTYIEKAATLEQFETTLWMAIEQERVRLHALGMEEAAKAEAAYQARIAAAFAASDGTKTKNEIIAEVDAEIKAG